MPRFTKYSGAGNDFVIARAEEVGMVEGGWLARRICPRSTGVGVDGLILARSMSDELVRARFFNPDGSEFGTCGNGSRCVAHYAYERGLVPESEFNLVTDDGEIAARVSGGSVSLDFEVDVEVTRRLEVSVNGVTSRASLVMIGTPHLIVPVDRVDLDDFDDAARRLRHHPELGEAGANVDLVQRDPDADRDADRDPTPGSHPDDDGVGRVAADRLRIRTFERGVEGETLACGSGSMAAAFALHQDGQVGRAVELKTRSGATLAVELLDGGAIRLTGPAWHVFDGVYPD